jgi:hypothetical protein
VKRSLNKRRNTRARFSHPVILRKGRRRILGWMDNISLKGMHVCLEKAPKGLSGTEISFEIELSAGIPRIAVRGKARIVRHDGTGYGINFMSMRAADLVHIRRLLEFNLVDAKGPRRELRTLFIRKNND